MAWHQQHPTGELLSNANSDVEAAWAPIAPLPMAVGTLAMMVIAIAQMLFTDLPMALVGLLVFPLVMVVNVVFQRLSSPIFTRIQALRAELSEIAHESFDGAMVVKTLGREGEETDRFAAKARVLRDEGIRAGRHPRGLRPVPGEPAQPRGARRARRRRPAGPAPGRPTPATWSRSPTCSRSWRSRSGRSAGCSGSSRARWSATTGCTGCSTRSATRRTARAGWSPTSRGRRARASTTSTTPTRPGSVLLDGVDFTIEPGRTVAVVGATASGQEHAHLAGDPAGRPAGGHDPRRRPGPARPRARASSRPTSRWCPQSAFLFDDTVRGNVTLGRRHPRRRGLGGAAHRPGRRVRRRACRAASTASWGSAAPRFPAASGSGSRWPVRWSAGRGCSSSTTPPRRSTPRSRRASSPPCVSAGATRRCCVIAYRKATIALADEVLFLDGGRIADRGTHQQLLDAQPRLRHPGQRLRDRGGAPHDASTSTPRS